MNAQPPTEPPVRPEREGAAAKSVVILNTGDGKGKSTAAFGTVMRALARDWKVGVVQFLKSGEWKVGEKEVAESLGVDWLEGGDGFTWDSEDLEASKAYAAETWARAAELIAAGEHRLVVLDEITYPLTWGWLDMNLVVDAIRARPENVNVILTGRDAPAELIELADTVTEMRNIKHAYDKGIPARRGIDF